MSDIRKVPASAGAQWLLTGFSLFRKSPLRLGQLGVMLGLGGLLGMAMSQLNPALGVLAQLLVVFGAPVLMGGLIWALRETERGATPLPRHLLEGFHAGRLPHLLVAVLPYFLASIVLGSLLFVLVGNEGVQRWQEVQNQINGIAQTGEQLTPDQLYDMAASLPVFRILLWIAITLLANLAIGLMLAVMLPQVMFAATGGWAALINSLRVCARNLAAMAIFYVLALIFIFVLNFTAAVIMLILGAVLGPGIGLVLALALYAAIALPVFAGAIYSAWKQMFGHDAATPPLPANPGNVFEA